MTCLIPHAWGEKNCPQEWAQHAALCYKVITAPRASWSEAGDLCRLAGGELALPVTQDENKFLWAMFRAQNLSKAEYSLNGGIWMGCRRAGAFWDCTHSSTLQFVSWWRAGEPDESHDCVVMWRSAAKWSDVGCENRRFTACQRRLGECSRRPRCLLQHSGPQQLGCLMNHVLKEVQVTNPMQCCMACYNEPRCRSINLQETTCQLNIAQHSGLNLNGANFTAASNACAYYEIQMD